MYGQDNGSGAVGRAQPARTTGGLSAGPTLIGEATGRVESALQRVSVAANRLREFNDGIHGVEPRAAITNGMAANPPASTRGDGLRQMVASLEYALNELEGELARLDRI